jgi:hypothetical protein
VDIFSGDLIVIPYLLKTPLLSHVNFLVVIPPKPCVIFAPHAFFKFRAMRVSTKVFRQKLLTLYLET